jgi:hypothetical protein
MHSVRKKLEAPKGLQNMLLILRVTDRKIAI